MTTFSTMRICILLLLAASTMVGCREDIDEIRPYGPAQDALNQLLSKVPEPTTETVFQESYLTEDVILTTQGGVRVFLTDPDALFADETGTPVLCSTCADLKVTVVEAVKKGDLIARGLPTMMVVGADTTWLDNAGAVKVTVTCNNQPLYLMAGRNLKIQIPADDPASDFMVYHGVEDQGDFAHWSNDMQAVYQAEWPIAGGGIQEGFEILTRELGWVSAQKTLSPSDKEFCIEMSGQFADENTLVFLAFKNERTVLTLPAVLDPGTRKYCLKGAPAGHLVRMITVSKVGDQYYLGQEETETGQNGTRKTVIPNKVNADQIIAFLKSL